MSIIADGPVQLLERVYDNIVGEEKHLVLLSLLYSEFDSSSLSQLFFYLVV